MSCTSEDVYCLLREIWTCATPPHEYAPSVSHNLFGTPQTCVSAPPPEHNKRHMTSCDTHTNSILSTNTTGVHTEVFSGGGGEYRCGQRVYVCIGAPAWVRRLYELKLVTFFIYVGVN